MRSSLARIAAVTAALMVAGAVFGGLAGAIAVLVAVNLTDGPVSPGWMISELAATIGAVLGSVLLPLTSWLLLRKVPLGLSWIGTTLGAMAGGVLGWVAANWAVSGDAFIWPIIGAVAGFFASVLVLRIRFSRPAPRRVSVA